MKNKILLWIAAFVITAEVDAKIFPAFKKVFKGRASLKKAPKLKDVVGEWLLVKLPLKAVMNGGPSKNLLQSRHAIGLQLKPSNAVLRFLSNAYRVKRTREQHCRSRYIRLKKKGVRDAEIQLQIEDNRHAEAA